MRRRMASLLVGIALATPALGAHHSIAAVYDGARQATLEGTVVRFEFINPHPFVWIQVEGERAGEWRLEMDNRSELSAIGVTADTLKPGDRVVVAGSLARSKGNGLYIRRLERPADGFQYEQVGSRPRIQRRAP